MTLRLTKVDDLMAGWSWEATPMVDGYRYTVLDPEGNPWGGDIFVGYQTGNHDNGIGGYYCNLAESWLHTDRQLTYKAYVEKHRFEYEETKPRKVSKHGDWLVKKCISQYLRYRVHPKERPTLGVKYVGGRS